MPVSTVRPSLESPAALPRCRHEKPWKTCAACARQAWCEDCGASIELPEPPHPRETVTCEQCVDRMIGMTSRPPLSPLHAFGCGCDACEHFRAEYGS